MKNNLIISIITLVLIFAIGELTINVLYFLGPSEVEDPIRSEIEELRGARPDPVLNRAHIPGLKFVYRAEDKQEFETFVEYNSKGLNDYEYDYKKPENTVRILAFGDSFVEAIQVRREENFCGFMERVLNSGNLPKRYEIINMGVSGYSPILEYLYLKNEGLKYEPDIVVLYFFMNDVYEDSLYKGMATFSDNGLPVKVHWRGVDKVEKLEGWKKRERKIFNSVKSFLNKSKFYVFLKERVYRLLAMVELKEMKKEEKKNPFFILTRDPIPKESQLWDETFGYISAIREMTKEKGIKFLLVIIPIEAQLSENPHDATFFTYFKENPYSERANERIAQFCGQYDIEYINLMYELKRGHPGGLYFKNDGHFTIRGHMVAADIVLKKLRMLGWTN